MCHATAPHPQSHRKTQSLAWYKGYMNTRNTLCFCLIWSYISDGRKFSGRSKYGGNSVSTELIGGKNKPSKSTVHDTEQTSGICAWEKTWVESDDIYTHSVLIWNDICRFCAMDFNIVKCVKAVYCIPCKWQVFEFFESKLAQHQSRSDMIQRNHWRQPALHLGCVYTWQIGFD